MSNEILEPGQGSGKREFGFNWADEVDDHLGFDRGIIVPAKNDSRDSTSDSAASSGENSPTEAVNDGKLAGPAGTVGVEQAACHPSDPWWSEPSPMSQTSVSLSGDNYDSPTSPSNDNPLEWRPSLVNFKPAEPSRLPQTKQRNRTRFKQHTKQAGVARPSYEYYESQAAQDPFAASLPRARAIIESTEPVKVVEDLWADYK